MRDARLIRLRRDNRDIIGQRERDALQHIEAFSVNAVVIGDQNAHSESLSSVRIQPFPSGRGFARPHPAFVIVSSPPI